VHDEDPVGGEAVHLQNKSNFSWAYSFTRPVALGVTV
jgi:hypothetical protein